MLTRRDLLIGLGVGSIGPFATACNKSRSRRPQLPSWPRTNRYEDVEMIELFPREADETAPLVVAIHGMGDRPDRWVDDWSHFPARVQIALPRAFEAHGDGFSWFALDRGMTDEQLGAAVGAAEARLWKGVLKLAGVRRVIVTGFSQGGILSYAMASRHADIVSRAFPVSGSCPGPLLPKENVRAAPVLAFHGTADRVLDVTWDREAIHAFKARGNDATLREYEGVGHTLTTEMHADLWDAIVKSLASP